MKRTLEKLAHERKEKETAYTQKLAELKTKSLALVELQKSLQTSDPLSSLETGSSVSKKLRKKSGGSPVASALQEFQRVLKDNLTLSQELSTSLVELAELNIELMESRDKEWDALGSNHVGQIFKSLEWRVDKLRASSEDATLLMKDFIALKEQLKRLTVTLEKEELPSAGQVNAILQPLEDFSYTGFENRFRGTASEVKAQQKSYLPYFQAGSLVLDLGCGRGEFLELLGENGVEAEGIDINEQMIAVCREKGFSCRKADILAGLAEFEDGSLGGIFSSQVIEHLSPPYLKRLIELAYFKLAPNGCLILETLNPTSVFSLVQVYFLDLSHQQPIHPRALQFLLENAGFEDVTISFSSPLEEEKLQTIATVDESTQVQNQNWDKLNQLLFAPVNYAAIGIKK